MITSCVCLTGVDFGPDLVKLADQRIALPLRSSADTEGEVARVLGKLEESGNDLRILRLLANSNGMFRPFVLLADRLLRQSRVPPAARELVILHLAVRRAAPYEWDEHVPMSAAAGVTDEQRAAVAAGRVDDPAVFAEPERLAMRAAGRIVDATLTQEDWDEIEGSLGTGAALDLVLTVGWWGAFVPTIIGALGLERTDDR